VSILPIQFKRGTLAKIQAQSFLPGEPVADWDDPATPRLLIADRTGTARPLALPHHSHPTSELTGLQALLDGKAPAVHNHALADLTGLTAALEGKAPSIHNHNSADISGLTALLAGKAASVHAHGMAEVTGLEEYLNNIRQIDVRNYGAIPNDLSFDQSPAFHAAIAAAAVIGATVFVPKGRYACNILLDVQGVNIEGDSWQGGVSTHNYLCPWDITKPVLQLGNNTKLLNGFYVSKLTLSGTGGPNGVGQIGLRMPGGVNRCHLKSISVRRFSSIQMSLESTGAYCTEYVFFDGLNLEGNTVVPGAAVLNLHYGGEVSGSWVTAVYINNFTIQSMEGEPCIVNEGVAACFTNGWIQCGMGTATSTGGIVLKTRTTGGGSTYYPSFAGWNVQMEVAGVSGLPADDVRRVAVIHYANSKSLGIWLRGDWSFALGCRMKLLDGSTIPIDNLGPVFGDPQLLYPTSVATHFFAETSNPSAENCTLEQVSGNFELRNSTNGAYISVRSSGNLDFYPFGARALQLTGVSNAVNYLKGTSNVAGGSPRLSADGSDPNLNLGIGGKGTGDVNVITGNLTVETIGKGLRVKEGANAKQGVATLVSGAVTVANTNVTATSRIFLQRQTDGGTVGATYSVTRTANTSFTIQAKNASGANITTDTSTLAWVIFDPA